MQRSFSIVEDDDIEELEKDEESSPKKNQIFPNETEFHNSDSEELSNGSPKRITTDSNLHDDFKSNSNVLKALTSRLPSASTSSGRQSVLKSSRSPQKDKLGPQSSDSEGDDSDNDKNKIPGEYDPTLYENLDVDDEIKEIFQYINKYIPQQLTLDYKFKPFVPEFLPAVGDIDAFLKIVPPDTLLSDVPFDPNNLLLGLKVLDEPAANQSDPALLHLQLRASSVGASTSTANIVVKKVDDVDKGTKTIDKWIKDISDLHKSKSSPIVRYTEPMPDLDELMQEWPEEMENYLKENGFPRPEENMTTSEYVDVVCNMFKIPITKNKVHSLHVLFCLYAAVRNSQLYQASTRAANPSNNEKEVKKSGEEADQLVLD